MCHTLCYIAKLGADVPELDRREDPALGGLSSAQRELKSRGAATLVRHKGREKATQSEWMEWLFHASLTERIVFAIMANSKRCWQHRLQHMRVQLTYYRNHCNILKPQCQDGIVADCTYNVTIVGELYPPNDRRLFLWQKSIRQGFGRESFTRKT